MVRKRPLMSTSLRNFFFTPLTIMPMPMASTTAPMMNRSTAPQVVAMSWALMLSFVCSPSEEPPRA